MLQGYYVGYKTMNGTSPYMYHTIPVTETGSQEHTVTNLDKFTRYNVVVQAFNRRGAGPRTEQFTVTTLEDGKKFPILSLCGI